MPSPTSSTSSSTDSASPPASESANGSGPQRRKAGGPAWPVERCESPARAALAESQTAQDAVLDQLDTLLGDAFEVELLRQAARVERVVGDRDLLVEMALTELAAEVAPLLEERQAAEGVEGEVLQQLADRVRPEHCTVDARRQLFRVGGPARELGGFTCDRGGIDVSNRPRGLLRIARGAVRCGER
jgi:hypothetical protein